MRFDHERRLPEYLLVTRYSKGSSLFELRLYDANWTGDASVMGVGGMAKP